MESRSEKLLFAPFATHVEPLAFTRSYWRRSLDGLRISRRVLAADVHWSGESLMDASGWKIRFVADFLRGRLLDGFVRRACSGSTQTDGRFLAGAFFLTREGTWPPPVGGALVDQRK